MEEEEEKEAKKKATAAADGEKCRDIHQHAEPQQKEYLFFISKLSGE
jgi:hypothetical protein